MRSLIIEDEQDNRENLRLLLQNYCPDVEVVGEGINVQSGLEAIRKHKPELVFLDVEMPDGTGFDLLRSLPKLEFEVIFVTAYSHYAIRAIKFNALDYILKPIDISELSEAVEKATRQAEQQDSMLKIQNLLSNLHTREVQNRRLPLASAESLRLVELKDIIRLQGENNYTRFYLTEGPPLLVSRTLKEYATQLEESDFLRVHQSHVVNVNHITSFVKSEGGYLVMRDGSQVGIARNRKQMVLERLYGGG